MSDKTQDRPAPLPASGAIRLPRKRSRSGSETRERNYIIKVRAKKEERDEMRANAAAAGLSLSSFIRSVTTLRQRTRAVRRPLPELKPFVQAMGRLGIYASNIYQLLRLANRGELVYTDELADASKSLREAADELLKVIRG
jgi:hypothetical protein